MAAHEPISVHEKMRAMGLEQVPSTALLAPIFREAGVARVKSKKKPRSAWRRFVYPAPNACWQLDSTEYVLAGGRSALQLRRRLLDRGLSGLAGGKNERFHQTLFRYLDKQPLADTLAELQAQVVAFDHIYTQPPGETYPPTPASER